MYAVMMCLFLLTPFFPHTEADTKMLGDVMWLENGHTGKTEEENREVLILTGVVPVNRAISGEWGGNTIKEVIYAKGQYANSTKDRIGKTDTPDWVYQLADDIMTYGTNVPEYVVYQSMQPRLGTRWKVIDGEYFATNGGHKDEGFNYIAETNGSCSRYFGSITNLFRDTCQLAIDRADQIIRSRFSDLTSGGWLGFLN